MYVSEYRYILAVQEEEKRKWYKYPPYKLTTVMIGLVWCSSWKASQLRLFWYVLVKI